MITACFVRAGPIRCNIRGTLCQLIFMPSPISGTRICALEAMMRNSNATASATPPPMQKPSMAAIVPSSGQARPELQVAPQTPNIHGLARTPFRVFQVKAGAECLCAAGQYNGRRIVLILKTVGYSSQLADCFGRKRIDSIASIKPHYGNAAFWAESLFDVDEVRQISTPLLSLACLLRV